MRAMRNTSGRRLPPAGVGALLVTFAVGATLSVAVAPALSDISPPPSTLPTTPAPSPAPGPSPDPAPTTTATRTTPKKAASASTKASTPKPKPSTPAPTSSTPVHTFAPAPLPTPAPVVSRPVVHHAAKKTVARPKHAKKKPARPSEHRTVKRAKPKPHGVLGARASKTAAPIRAASPVAPAASSNGLRRALLILLVALPAIVLAATFVPPTLVPYRMVLAWRDTRLNLGLLAASILLLEALLYLLIR
jgi:hypothetical protein